MLYVGSSPAREGRERVYQVVGQVFFSSADQFIASSDYEEVIRCKTSRKYWPVWTSPTLRTW